jgi:hypothetical protein
LTTEAPEKSLNNFEVRPFVAPKVADRIDSLVPFDAERAELQFREFFVAEKN